MAAPQRELGLGLGVGQEEEQHTTPPRTHAQEANARIEGDPTEDAPQIESDEDQPQALSPSAGTRRGPHQTQ